MFGRPARRTLGLVLAGDDGVFRSFGHCCSAGSFGHAGAGGQIAWADPETGMPMSPADFFLPEEYRHIRWVMQSDLMSGAQGTVRFTAELN